MESIKLGNPIAIEIPISKFLADAISEFFRKTGEAFINAIVGFIKFLKTEIFDKILEGIKTISEWFVNKIKNFWGGLVDSLRGLDVNNVWSRTGLISIGVIGAGIGLSLLISLLQTSFLGIKLDLKALWDVINEFISPKWVVSIGLGVLLGESLKIVLERWAKRTFQYHLPNPSDAFVMYRLGYLSENELKEIFVQNTGINERYFKGWLDVMTRAPSVFDWFRIFRNTTASSVLMVPFITKGLKQLGYDDSIIPYLTMAILREPIRDEAERVSSDIYVLYRDGWIREDELRERLKQLGFRDDEIELRILHAKLLYFKKLREEKLQTLIIAFRKDLITKEMFLNSMLQLGLSIDLANIYLEQELARKGVAIAPFIELIVPTTKITLTSIVEYSIS